MWEVTPIPNKDGGVYIPFPWPLIKDMNLKLGDLFDFKVNKDKELILTRNKSGKKGKRTLELIEYKGDEKTASQD